MLNNGYTCCILYCFFSGRWICEAWYTMVHWWDSSIHNIMLEYCMNWKRFFTILAILTLIIFGVYFIFQYNNIEQSITITDLFKLVDEYKIKYIQISGNKVKAIGVNNFQYIIHKSMEMRN